MVSKQEQEIFQAFVARESNFVAEAVKCSVGSDPPDFLCQTNQGRKIGVELGEWLHEAQTERARALEGLEKKIATESVEQNFATWLDQYGVLLYPKMEVDPKKADKFTYIFPRKIDRPGFISELFFLLQNLRDSEQKTGDGLYWKDFSQSSGLRRFLTGIRISKRMPGRIHFAGGGSFSPEEASHALRDVITRKTHKKNYKTLKRDQALDQLYLVVYYDRGPLWNSPYEGIDGGLENIVAEAQEWLGRDHGPLDKAFLFLACEPEKRVFALWP